MRDPVNTLQEKKYQSYEVAKKRAEPYDKLVGELPRMRRENGQLGEASGGGAVFEVGLGQMYADVMRRLKHPDRIRA